VRSRHLVIFAVLLGVSAGAAMAEPSVSGTETQALVQRMVLERAASIAALQRVADEREEQLFADLAAKDRKLRAEQKAKKAAQADLAQVAAALAGVTAERQKLVDEIAARDRRFGADLEEYQNQIASIANSPDPRKREALKRYAEGDRVEAFDDLVSIQDELDRANDKASAAGWSELGALALDLKDRGEKDTNAAIAIFEKAQKKDPEHAWGWVELGRLYREAGRLADARPAAEQALAQARDEWDRSVALDELGDVLVLLGDLLGARSRYESSLKIAEALAASSPDSTEVKRDLSVSQVKVGDALVSSWDLKGARARYESGLKIREALAASNPTSAEAQRDVSESLGRVGDVLEASGDLAGARARYESSVKIDEGLAASNPSSVEAQRDVSTSLLRLGDVLAESGDLPGAQSRIEAGLKTLESLAASNPGSAEAQRDVSAGLGKLGAVLLLSEDLPGARARYESSLKIREALAASNPSSAEAQRDVSVSLSDLGDVLEASGDLAGARVRYESSLKINEGLAASNPESAEAQRDLIEDHTRLAELPGGEGHWKEALRIALALQSQGRLSPADEEMLADLRERVAETEHPKEPQ
jgi:tetratricopeptide (TPR) repeat protein